jgi:glycosyltransferase involved in cell wall biosynthesis
MQLKAEFQIPWVADFRDPWTDSAMGYFNPFKWRRRLDVRLERRIYQIADLTIANTISNRQTILTKHQVPVEKVLTITNGYDEEDFADIPPAPPCVNRFRIMYAGSFYGSYNPTVFLQAFREFLRTEPDANVVLTLAGSCCSWAKGFIKDPMVLRHLEPLGYLPHRHVCKLLAGSDLLLHVYPKGIPYSVPGKLYEYLRTGRPIVAVCDRPSELASLLEQTGCGRAFRHCDLRDLTQFLRECYARWRAGDAPPTRTPAMCVRAYDRRTLTRQLACIFDALAGHNTMDMVLSR